MMYFLYLLFSSWGIIAVSIITLVLYLICRNKCCQRPYGDNLPDNSCRPDGEDDPNFYRGEK